MGCCVSSESRKGKRTRWVLWKRRKEEQKVQRPTDAESKNGYHGYEKTLADSPSSTSGSISSHATDKPTFVGLWTYAPGSKAELSIRPGDRFRLMGDPNGELDPEWLFVMRQQLADRRWTGYVPKAYVAPAGSLELEPWYFGQITGEAAGRHLSSMPDGSFLVRKRPVFHVDGTQRKEPKKCASITEEPCRPGRKARSEYAITFKHDGKIVNRPIYQYTDSRASKIEFFLSKKQIFPSIPLMIAFFGDDGAHLKENNIPCALKKWPPKKPPARIVLSLETQRMWREIPRSQIRLGQVKGRGHFGVVHEGTWNTPDGKSILVAVKALKKGSTRAKRKFLQEAVTMKSLRHEHLVKLYGVVSEEPFWIITEFVKDGSLLAYLEKRRSNKQLLSGKTLIDVCAQICDGMRYLEKRRVVHSDLAARNVLVSEECPGAEPVLLVKVADFGLARLVNPAQLKETSGAKCSKRATTVPTKWTAPEALEKGLYSSASDVWSFGVMVHEIFSHGLEPYGILRHVAVRDYVLHKRQILRRHSSVPDRVYEMMMKCFSFDPRRRPDFEELYAFFHHYYRKSGESSLSTQ